MKFPLTDDSLDSIVVFLQIFHHLFLVLEVFNIFWGGEAFPTNKCIMFWFAKSKRRLCFERVRNCAQFSDGPCAHGYTIIRDSNNETGTHIVQLIRSGATHQ